MFPYNNKKYQQNIREELISWLVGITETTKKFHYYLTQQMIKT